MKLLAGSYDNGATADDEKAILLSFQSESREIYKDHPHEWDIAYGGPSREVFDWFYSTGENKGTVVFLHDGYCQFCNKEDVAFIAKNLLLFGFDVVLVEYTLAPTATLADICQQIGVAVDAIEQRVKQRGGKPVYLSAHSAGGQLAAFWQHYRCVRVFFAISGIFELEPLLTTYVNQQLKLTAQQTENLSFLVRNIPQSLKPLALLYGTEELPELIGQSVYYHSVLQDKGLLASCCPVNGANHFSALQALFATDGMMCRQLLTYGEISDANNH
ncbi:alpha/beta hydrolase [Serratia sp. UGAL515B_01]|uniref:alpha/beta hydrolase n=1 Tax=Serratia sp. UGAL515B_01 TaxID=2986763 RepID=UPI0029558BF5|nr:alpha/beta hydrolase [Serratia sp. UGAL515B_01]WON78511.1 alpha/beta hydrolase [Serratia sp. UGAL515B_01]